MSEIDLRDRINAPLGCTNCGQTVMVRIDRHATGNLTIECPNCEHEHFRYVENGVITEDRWRPSALMIPACMYSSTASTDTMTWTSDSGTASGYLRDSWYNTDTASNSW